MIFNEYYYMPTMPTDKTDKRFNTFPWVWN